jgi:hypothetical protein
MRSILSVMSGVCFVLVAEPCDATIIISQSYTCPGGGQKFKAATYGSWFGYDGRPDGRPLGTMRGYVDIPECPKNKLLLYRAFSPEERKVLAEIIKSRDYLTLVQTENRFYRAAWLEKAINPHSAEYVWYLLRATWYVDKDPERKTRYRNQFLAIAEGIPANPTDMRSMRLRLRVLNVYRETGQFDRALQGVESLPVDDMAKGLPEDAAEADRLNESDQARWDFVHEARLLQKLIQRQDASVNPIDVLPEWMAEEECYFRQPKSDFEAAFCSNPEMQARLKEDKEMFEEERAFYDYDGPIQAPPPPPAKMHRYK